MVRLKADATNPGPPEGGRYGRQSAWTL